MDPYPRKDSRVRTSLLKSRDGAVLRWPVQQLWRLEIRPTQVKPLEDVENYFTEHKDEPRGRRVFRAQSRRYELGSLNLANKDYDCGIFCSRLAFLKALR